MWHAMFVEQIPLAEKILRTVIVYALIAVLFRLTGKRGLASLNTFDFIVIFLLSNVIQNAVIGNDTSIVGGMIGAVTLVAVNVGVNRLIAVSARAAWIFEGHQTKMNKERHQGSRPPRRGERGGKPADRRQCQGCMDLRGTCDYRDQRRAHGRAGAPAPGHAAQRTRARGPRSEWR